MFVLTLRLRGLTGKTIETKLPCARADFRNWIALADDPKSDKEFVFSNPALLLAAVSQAASCSALAPRSGAHLTERLEHCLAEGDPLDTLLARIVKVKPADFTLDTESKYRLLKFHKSTDAKQLKKSLVRLLRHFNKKLLPKKRRTSTAEFQSVVESLFAKQFTRTFTSPVDPERSNRKPTCNDRALLAMIESRQQQLSSFEHQLEQRKLQSMRLLAYGASHEINNPLANIATRAQNLIASETNPERRFQLSVVYEQAMRAHDMISDMMLFAHPPKPDPSRNDVRIFLAELVKECRRSMTGFDSMDIDLSAHIGRHVDFFSFDSNQLGVLLKGLVRNAVEAMGPDGGEILLRVSRGKKSMKFFISDTGQGISDDCRPHVFDPFYSGREAGRGLGFGLSKAWRIAQEHGGCLRLQDKPEDGFATTFVLSLPPESEE